MKDDMDWFRMYAEARTDRKLAALADDEHRVWFDLLCFAAGNDGDRRGTFDISDKALLAVEVARADEELLDRTLDKLQRLRIVHFDEQTGTFCSFKKRQYDKPSDTPERVAERVRAHRERQRNAINMEGTRKKRAVTPSNTPYTDTESDSESSEPKGSKRAASASLSPPTTRAVQEANKILHLRCDETQREAINAAVSDAEDAIALWVAVLKAWKLRYPHNKGLAGPLDWFRDGGAPERNVTPLSANGRPARVYAGPSAVAEYHRLKGTFDGTFDAPERRELGGSATQPRLSG